MTATVEKTSVVSATQQEVNEGPSTITSGSKQVAMDAVEDVVYGSASHPV
jgi:hypothetical protein